MEENKKGRVFRIIMLVILVAFITFMLTSLCFYQYLVNNGIYVNDLVGVSSEVGDIVKKINEYKRIIDKNFLGNVDEKKLVEGAVKGYVDALDDPYTEYISEDEMEEYMEDTTGNFVGVGIYMVKNTENNKIQVLAPIKNSPAEIAGILPEDYIISVDGKEYSGDEMSTCANEIKGKEGSTVKLKIQRGDQLLDFELKREMIRLNPVEGKVLENNIGYIEFTSFDEGTAEDFKAKFEELSNQGIKSLIIDLRNNGGGIVSEALKIADYIVPKDKILLYEVDKDNKEEVEKSKEDPIIDMPIIILTNGNTASSSEILAGALKDNGEAKIVGTKTFGKGVIQRVLQSQDGSGIKITSEKYLTPNRTDIQEVGIEPDENVELPENIQNVLTVEEKDDTQLQKAIELLK